MMLAHSAGIRQYTLRRRGLVVPVFSLETIVREFDVPEGSILKADCEGCEYDLIISSDSRSLSKFREIFLEYHYGARALVDRLTKVGFKVKSTRPKRVFNEYASSSCLQDTCTQNKPKGSREWSGDCQTPSGAPV
ncbi:MAG: hypothetical protein QW292_03940 [Candidatus Parvarchaeota archaeon]